ncbi:MAG: hypothetical protein GY940_08535, partial [bacterium]|nr:hypothetical protein [bacterium]
EWNAAHQDTLEKELQRLADFLVLNYKEKGTIPVKNFQFNGENKNKRKKGIFQCAAGKHRMSVTPGGIVWGCSLLHDYFKTGEETRNSQYQDFAFGTLTDFIANYETCYPKILDNYSQLRQDYFQVEREQCGETDYCFLCQEVEGCMVCPVNAAYSSGSLGKISCRKCKLVKLQANARNNFIEKLQAA